MNGVASLKLKYYLLHFPVSSLLSAKNNNGKLICKWQNLDQQKTNQIFQIYHATQDYAAIKKQDLLQRFEKPFASLKGHCFGRKKYRKGNYKQK